MAKRLPVVLVAGRMRELPTGDALPFDEATYSLAVGTDVTAIDLAVDNVVRQTLTAATTISISNWPQGSTTLTLHLTHGAGGPFAVTAWGVSHWIGGVPDFTASAIGDIEIVTITSTDGGLTRIGAHVGTAKPA